MLGIFLPEKYGGAGLDHVAYSLVLEELAVECASTAVIMSAHCSLASWPILGLGTAQQKDHFLPKMATGSWLGCFALTEPQAGSDAAGQKTRAVRDGDSYVINGTKNFITNAPQSKVAIVFAMTQPDKGHHGISAFAVETDTPGWAVTRVEDKMGIHGAHSAQLSFSDMRVPRENLLLEEGQGFKVAMKTLDGGRIGIASQALGIARASLEASLKYAQERLTFGKPIAQYQAIQWKLADMAVEIDAARLLTHRAATLKDRGDAVHQGIRDGEAVRRRDRDEIRDRGGADSRRLRLHQGVQGRALFPRRQDYRNLRRHVGDSAPRHRRQRARKSLRVCP